MVLFKEADSPFHYGSIKDSNLWLPTIQMASTLVESN